MLHVKTALSSFSIKVESLKETTSSNGFQLILCQIYLFIIYPYDDALVDLNRRQL